MVIQLLYRKQKAKINTINTPSYLNILYAVLRTDVFSESIYILTLIVLLSDIDCYSKGCALKTNVMPPTDPANVS